MAKQQKRDPCTLAGWVTETFIMIAAGAYRPGDEHRHHAAEEHGVRHRDHRVLRSWRALFITLIFASLPVLTACDSPEAVCGKAHPGDPAAANACLQAGLKQQNGRLNETAERELNRGNGFP